MPNTVKADTPNTKEGEYIELLMAIEEHKLNYRQELRPLIWYRNVFIVFFIILVLAIITYGIFDQTPYVNTWILFVLIGSAIILLALIIYFLLDEVTSTGDHVGLRGFTRLKNLVTLKEDLETLEVQTQVIKNHQTILLSVQNS
jgi:hypothetical protein